MSGFLSHSRSLVDWRLGWRGWQGDWRDEDAAGYADWVFALWQGMDGWRGDGGAVAVGSGAAGEGHWCYAEGCARGGESCRGFGAADAVAAAVEAQGDSG